MLCGAGLALLAATSGCVQQAVLENDVRSAQWKARTLATATDLRLAEAALSAQLVELEALYQRAARDRRVLGLLDRGYQLMARGFVEVHRLEAVAAGDRARAAQEAKLAADAEARAKFYRAGLAAADQAPTLALQSELGEAERACQRHDRAGYEQALNLILAQPERDAEQRLERELLRRQAAAWLLPGVAARCAF